MHGLANGNSDLFAWNHKFLCPSSLSWICLVFKMAFRNEFIISKRRAVFIRPKRGELPCEPNFSLAGGEILCFLPVVFIWVFIYSLVFFNGRNIWKLSPKQKINKCPLSDICAHNRIFGLRIGSWEIKDSWCIPQQPRRSAFLGKCVEWNLNNANWSQTLIKEHASGCGPLQMKHYLSFTLLT